MEDELFDAMHAHADQHWWFRARQRIVTTLLDQHFGTGGHAGARVLDLGCGAGNNLRVLERYGQVHGADPSPRALAHCRQRFDGPLALVHLPEEVPYPGTSFDLIVMLDVLEHIEDDEAALQQVLGMLVPGGTLCMTVPALRWMWSHHDVEHHHHRRYHGPELRSLLMRQGFDVILLSYMNTLLFPVMAAARVLLRPRAGHKAGSAHDLEAGTGVLGQILYSTFALERHLLGKLALPIGGSLIALARRPA